MKQVWIFGHKIDWQRCEVTTTKATLSVEPRVLEVLQVLVAAKGEVVSHHDLLDQIWGKVHVAPNALQRCIAQLRKIFGDDAKQQLVIKTHPKRGYSLVATVTTKPPSSGTKSLSMSLGNTLDTARLLAISGVLISLMAIVIGWLVIPPTQQLIAYNTIIPLTSSDQVERSPVLSDDHNFLAFISADSANNTEQLVVKNLNNNQMTELLSVWRLRGSVAFSPDNSSLAYAELVKVQGIKCSKIMAVSLKSNSTRVLQSCRDNFLSDPIWLSLDQLLYIQTSKAGVRQLRLLDLANGVSRQITTSSHSLVGLSYHRASKQLALLSQANSQQLYLSIATLNHNIATIITTASWPINIPWQQSLKPHWQGDNKIVVASKKSLYWYNKAGTQEVTKLLTNDAIYDVLPYLDNQLIVLMGQQDWDIRQTSWHNIKQQTIARSTYSEQQAQFIPLSDGVSFISHRTGTGQVWQQHQDKIQQISHSDSTVVSYIWSPAADKFAYVSNNKLWLKKIGQPDRQIQLAYNVTAIYQWLPNPQSQDSLLLNVLINNQPQVITLNLSTLEHRTKFVGPSQWAQKVSADRLIVNDFRGQLLKQTPQGRLPISALSHLTLHWRYFWRDNGLYFQDKQQNIWRYRPNTEQAEIVGRYDENSIFITDFSPAKESILTENFVGQRKDIFVFK